MGPQLAHTCPVVVSATAPVVAYCPTHATLATMDLLQRMLPLLVFFVALLSTNVPTEAVSRRSLKSRPLVGGGTTTCSNTKAGRWLSADERGMVCKREDLDPLTGCCSRGEQNSCNTCLEEDGCCAELEYCISCCMRPDHTKLDAHLHENRSPGREETGRWKNLFELCRGKCRTSSKSTVHENAFLGTRHHCYGERRRPLLEPQKATPKDITILGANQPNMNCNQVCSLAGKKCSPEHFPEVNHCDRLRDQFQCEAGCEKDTVGNRGADHPAYVIYKSSKETHPTMCLLNSFSAFDCGASHAKTQRICPCI